MQYDLFVPRDSWLHRLDPRTKLLLTLVALVICLLYQDMLVLAGVLVGFHLILALAGIPATSLGWLWARMLPLTLMVLILQPFFSSPAGGRILWEVGPVRWTLEGVLTGVMFALRVNSMAFAAAGLLFTTEPTQLVRGLVKLGLPYTWGLTVSLAIRYLPTTYGLYQSIHDAQRARGWDPGRGGLVRRLKNYSPMLVAVIIAALRMADNLAMALAARGLGAPYKRTMLRDIRFQPADWLMTFVLVSGLAAGLILRY